MLKIGGFGQACEVLLRSGSEIPSIPLRQFNNAAAHILVCIVEYVVEESVELLSEHPTQAVVCNSLVKKGHFDVGCIPVVGQYDRDFARALGIEAFCTGFFTIQTAYTCNHFNIVKVEFLRKVIDSIDHFPAFRYGRFLIGNLIFIYFSHPVNAWILEASYYICSKVE